MTRLTIPDRSTSMYRVAHGRHRACRSVVLEITVRKADHKRIWRHVRTRASSHVQMPCCLAAKLVTVSKVRFRPRVLDESLPHPPLVLRQQHPAQIGEPDGRIVKRAQDCLAILNGKTQTSCWVSSATMSASAVSSKPASCGSRARSSTSSPRTRTPATSSRPSFPLSERLLTAVGLALGLVHARFLFAKQHTPELGKRIGLGVVESSKDRLPFWDRESDHPRLALPRLLEPRGQVRFPGASEQTSQLEDVGVRDWDAGELHAQRATRAASRENAAGSGRLLTVDVAPESRRNYVATREGEWAGSALPPPLPLPREAVWMASPAVLASVEVP